MTFLLAPGADSRDIRLDFSGQRTVAIVEGGDLFLRLPMGEIRQRAPHAFQDVGGERRTIASSFVMAAEGRVGFQLGAYDHQLPLVIDPTVDYSTYLGGAGDFASGVAVDAAGSAYITGTTGSDAFVTKLDPSGTSVAYTTFLGGSDTDQARAIAVDAAGSAYITGSTTSTDFPTANPFQASNGGGFDAFVAKLSRTGSLVYATYLGGDDPVPPNVDSEAHRSDGGSSIAVGPDGGAYVVGTTSSLDFPAVGALWPYSPTTHSSDFSDSPPSRRVRDEAGSIRGQPRLFDLPRWRILRQRRRGGARSSRQRSRHRELAVQ